MTNRPTRKPLPPKAPRESREKASPCAVSARCGGCQLIHLTYQEQLARKQQQMEKLLGDLCPVEPILGMADSTHYRG